MRADGSREKREAVAYGGREGRGFAGLKTLANKVIPGAAAGRPVRGGRGAG